MGKVCIIDIESIFLQKFGMFLSLPQRGRGTAIAVDEEIPL